MENIATIPKKKPLFSISLLFFYLIAFLTAVLVINYFSTIKSDLKLFGQMRPIWILLALAGQAGTYYFNARVYQVLLRIYSGKTVFSLKELLQASIVMMFFNQIVPSAGLSGNAFFSRTLMKKGVAVEKSLSLMFLVLLTSYIAMTLLIGTLIIAGLFFNFPRFFFAIFALGILAFGVMSTFTALAGRGKTINYVLNKISRIGFIKKSIQSYKVMAEAGSSETENLIKILASKKAIALQAIACKIGIVAFDIFTVYALFVGFNISINPVLVATGYILTQIITLLPISPGSLLLYEGGMAFFFTQMNVPLEAAVTVVLLYRFLSFWLPIPFGFFLYRNTQKTA